MRLWEGTSSLMSRRYLGAASHARGMTLEMVQPRPTTASQMTAYEMDHQDRELVSNHATPCLVGQYHGGWWRAERGEPLLEHDDERSAYVLTRPNAALCHNVSVACSGEEVGVIVVPSVRGGETTSQIDFCTRPCREDCPVRTALSAMPD